MILQPYVERCPEIERELILRLHKSHISHRLILEAVYSDGQPRTGGVILSLCPEDGLRISGGVHPNLGLPLTKGNKVRIFKTV